VGTNWKDAQTWVIALQGAIGNAKVLRPKPLLEDYLYKVPQQMFHRAKFRWVALYPDGRLSWYQAPSEFEPICTWNLKSISLYRTPSTDLDFSFYIQDKYSGRKFKFIASNRDKHLQWINLLEKEIRRHQDRSWKSSKSISLLRSSSCPPVPSNSLNTPKIKLPVAVIVRMRSHSADFLRLLYSSSATSIANIRVNNIKSLLALANFEIQWLHDRSAFAYWRTKEFQTMQEQIHASEYLLLMQNVRIQATNESTLATVIDMVTERDDFRRNLIAQLARFSNAVNNQQEQQESIKTYYVHLL
jgi:hypothetical protein